jgi:hypothetical protein
LLASKHSRSTGHLAARKSTLLCGWRQVKSISAICVLEGCLKNALTLQLSIVYCFGTDG